MEIRKGSIGDEDVARIYTGDDIVHPLPVQDGLVLWYDFMGRKNSDAKRGIAEDLSGNGNHGTLANFAYQPGSGYEDGLRFDGVDDAVLLGKDLDFEKITISITFSYESLKSSSSLFGNGSWNKFGFSIGQFGLNNPYDLIWVSNIEGVQITRTLLRNLTLGKTYNITIVSDRTSSKLESFYEGSLDISTTAERSTSPEELRLGRGQWLNSNCVIKSFQLYNRALTPEEIAHNYAIEKERWNL